MPQDCLLRTNWNYSALNNLHSLITPRSTLASLLLRLSWEVTPGGVTGQQDPLVLPQVPLQLTQGTLPEMGTRVAEGARSLDLPITSNAPFLP